MRVNRSGVSLRNSTWPWPPPRSACVMNPASLDSKPGLIPHIAGVHRDVAAIAIQVEVAGPSRQRPYASGRIPDAWRPAAADSAARPRCTRAMARLGAVQRTAGHAARHHPVVPGVEEDMAVERRRRTPVPPAGSSSSGDPVGAMDHRREQAQRGARTDRVLRAADEVVGERLGLHVVAYRQAVRDTRVFRPGDRLEHAERPASPGLAGQLGRAEDGRRRRGVHVAPGGRRLRRPTDATRVEQLRLEEEVTPVLARAALAEPRQDLAALGEERALLFEERLRAPRG